MLADLYRTVPLGVGNNNKDMIQVKIVALSKKHKRVMDFKLYYLSLNYCDLWKDTMYALSEVDPPVMQLP